MYFNACIPYTRKDCSGMQQAHHSSTATVTPHIIFMNGYKNYNITWFTTPSVWFPAGVRIKFLSSPSHPKQFWAPPSLPSMTTRGSFPRGKWPEHETDHSPPSNAVQNTHQSQLPPCLHEVVLNELRDMSPWHWT